jgi:hypothetical protein
MAAPVILTVDNSADGLHAVVALQDPPLSPSFKVSRKPGIAGVVAAFTTVDSTHFQVTVRSTVTPVRTFYYVTAYDGVDESDQDGDWICPDTNHGRKELAHKAMHQILMDNDIALSRALQIKIGRRTWDDGSPVRFEKIVRGLPQFEAEGKNPHLSIRLPSWDEDLFFGNPYTDLETYGGTMAVTVYHQGSEAQEDFASAGAEGVKDVVNTLQYLDGYVIVETGNASHLQLTKFHVGNIRTSEYEDTDLGCWVALAEMNWECNCSVGKQV